MPGSKRRSERIEALVQEIREGAVRVFVTLDANGYNTEIWSTTRGRALEDDVRFLIGHGSLVIDKEAPNRGPRGPIRYSMKLWD